MLTANNGILIVALVFGYGLHTGDKVMIALAFAMAGLSYIANIFTEWEMDARAFAWGSILSGVAAYAYVALKIMGNI